MSGVFLLTVSTVLCKAIGFFTKVPLMRLLGSAGMGYYHTAYEVYAFLFVLSTAGLPVALSILICESQGEGETIWRRANKLFFGFGVAGSLALSLFARPIAALMGNGHAAYSLLAISPSVLFACICASVRGYYQGFQNMKPTAVSQVIEAFGKFAFGVLFATLAVRAEWTNELAAAAGSLGISAGMGASALYLMLSKTRARQTVEARHDAAYKPVRHVLRPLLRLAIPMTLSSGVLTLTRLLDMVLILRRLRVLGLSEAYVNTLYGTYATLDLPLYSLLPMLIGSLALPLVPGIAGARERGDLQEERRVAGLSMKLTLLLSVPSALGLSVFASPVLTFLFRGQEQAILIGAPLLSVLALSVPAGCFVTVTGAMLQAYRQPKLPIAAMFLGGALKLVSAFFLVGSTRYGMFGAPLSTLFCNSFIVLLQLLFLRPFRDGWRMDIKFPAKVILSSVVCVGSAALCYRWLSGIVSANVSFLISFFACVLLYAIFCFFLGLCREVRELRTEMPEGRKKRIK